VALPLDVVVSLERKPFIQKCCDEETESFVHKVDHWFSAVTAPHKLATDVAGLLITAKSLIKILTDNFLGLAPDICAASSQKYEAGGRM
jgi:hypothetical protein